MSSAGIVEIMLRSDLRPPASGPIQFGTVELVRVSPDGRRLAFYGSDGVDAGVYVCEAESVTAKRLVSLGGATIDELAWSPDGDHVAYVTGDGLPIGAERHVGWASSRDEGELGRLPGATFAWGANKPALIVADLAQQEIAHVDLASGDSLLLGEILDDGDLDFPPSIAVSSTGEHIAFSCRSSYHDRCEVWLLARAGSGTERTLLTQIPGADVGVRLFWSPKGKSLAMNIVHGAVEQTAIIVVHGLKGDGEILHHHDGFDVPLTPAWSPNGRWIALFCSMGWRHLQLAVLDVQARKLFPVNGSVLPGTPHFIDDDKLAIDGGASATLLELKLSDR
jgi:dipeptidyl aminopeptidase/acylaminoacyl peptidase